MFTFPATFISSEAGGGDFNLNSIDFDGSTEKMANSSDNMQGYANDWTVAIWLKPDTGAQYEVFGNRASGTGNDQIFIRILSSGAVLILTISSSGGTIKQWTTTSAVLSDNTIHYMVYSWDGTNLKMYVDDTEITSFSKAADNSGTMIDRARGMYLGGSNATNNYNGLISKCDIWNVALDTTNLTELYNSGSGYNMDSRDDVGGYDQSAALKHQYALGKNTGSNIGQDYVSSGNINISDNSLNISDADIVTFT